MKLYSKIFLSFLLTLVLAEFVIFGIFRLFIQEDRHQRFFRLAEAQAIIVREWIEADLHNRRDCPPGGARGDRQANMKQAVDRLAGLFHADVWIADHTGHTVARSFSGPVPVPAPDYEQHFKNFSMGWGHHGEGFARMPIVLPGERPGRLYALLPPHERTPLESSFAWALGGLALAFGLLLIPISRMLTGPLKRLRESAVKIAAGDLSERVVVKGHDEISELSLTFNTMADQIERMIRGSRELTAHVSHELRTPLARMRIAEEMLRENIDSGDKEPARRRCDAIRAEIEDLDRLIGKILTLSRLEMQAGGPARVAVHAREIAADLIERYRPMLAKKNLTLTETFAADAPPLKAAEGELRTVFENLLANAVKFTPEHGDIQFSLGTRPGPTGALIVIECANRAEIDADMDYSRIFEPFYRKTTNGAGGTGLGLTITRKIVENLGGSVTVRHDEQRVYFTILIPVREE